MIKESTFKDIYPVYTLDIAKTDTRYSTVDEICTYLKEQVDQDPLATFVAIFDHLSHTQKIEGEIMDGLIDVKNFVFCFGRAILSTKAVAIRPKSFGICEFEDKFILEFVKPPREEAAKTMLAWVEGIIR